MILRGTDAPVRTLEHCHDGPGAVECRELLADYAREGGGFRYIHDDVIPPGAGVGVHRHDGDEEIYVILAGRGTMHCDGQEQPIGPGDVCITRDGHTHGLVNTGDEPMRLLVVAAGL